MEGGGGEIFNCIITLVGPIEVHKDRTGHANSTVSDSILIMFATPLAIKLRMYLTPNSTFSSYVLICLIPPHCSQLQPPIILLDGVYECHDLEQVLAAAGGLSRKPYIISTLCSGTTKGVPLHQLLFHHQIRCVCSDVIMFDGVPL